jgi:predicted TPR repeat methyltransferase
MSDQKPNPKSIPSKEDLLSHIYKWSDWLADKLALPTSGWSKIKDIAGNNFELGKMHFQLGNISDAVFRFKMVTWLEPKHIDAWFFLGASYMAEKKIGLARKALQKALDMNPNYEEARYMMAIAKGKDARADEMPRRMPLSLALSHFESVAADYAQEQIEALEYRGHIILAQAVQANVVEGRVDHEIVELGVGPGFCGPLVRDIAARIIGVDMSGAMLEEAMKVINLEGEKIYDILLHKEMHEFLEESPNEVVDIIMSATAFSYVGDLSKIFDHAARTLRPGGLFAFTADPMEGTGLRLDPTVGRFRFSQQYLEEEAARNQFNIITMELVAAYPDYPMWLCVFSK